jgi:hypothetical protein
MFSSRPLLWDGWLLSNRTIDAPVNQDVLAWDEGWPGGYRTCSLPPNMLDSVHL